MMNIRNLLASAAFAAAALSAGAAFADAPNTQTATANGAANIIRPITITASGSLNFGTIVKPRSGGAAGTVAITNAASPARNLTGDLVAVGSSFSSPSFEIGGEGGQSYALTVPASFVLASGANNITVTLDPSMASGTHSFTGSIGSGQTDTLYVGGSIPVSDGTASGAYTGSFDVTVTYN